MSRASSRLRRLAAVAKRPRTLIVLGGAGALLVVAVAGALLAGRADTPPASMSVPTTSALTAAATPTLPALPPLPAGCAPVASISGFGAEVIRAGAPVRIEIQAQGCASTAWAAVPVEALTMAIVWQLQPPDGPRERRAELPAESTSDGLVWRGSVTYPEAGMWMASELWLGTVSVRPLPPPTEVHRDPGLVSGGAGLPLNAVPQQVTVLHLDRPDEPVRWDAGPASGLAWLPGNVPGQPARAVWVQTREGKDWVVAGDPTTGDVTQLFEVESSAQLIGAPDGRAVAVLDRLNASAQRLRVYSAERGSLIEVPVAANTHPEISWAPDSSVLLVTEQKLHLLRSDGSAILVRDEVATSAQVDWAPDSKSALVTVDDHGHSRIVRVDVNTSTTSVIFDYANGIERPGWDSLAISPDGRWIAIGWLDSTARQLLISVLTSDQPFATPISEHAVVSYQLPPDVGPYDWLETVVWAPDGTRLVFALGPTNPVTPGMMPASSLQILDVQTGRVWELARPSQGFYAGGPLWWARDGSAVFKTGSSCIACDAGGSGIDVIDVGSGKVVRTIERGWWRGTLDGVRQLISTPSELLTVRGLEAPRSLLGDTTWSRSSYTVAPSPDENWLAVIESPSFMGGGSVFAVAPDGTSQVMLGTVDQAQYVIEGLRDPRTALVRQGGAWGWASLLDGSVEPLPGSDTAMAVDKTTAAFTADGSRLAYWSGTSEQSRLQLVVVDTASGAVRPLDVFIQERAGRRLELSPRGERVAYVEGADLVTVEVTTGRPQRFSLAALGDADPPAGFAFVWSGDGGAVDILAGGKLWRADLATGNVSMSDDKLPKPGGWSGNVVLSRSPDGRSLVALTSFGLFLWQPDGSWQQISGAGAGRKSEPPRIVWSPDSKGVAYVAGDDIGLVVAPVDGSGAYELVRADPMRPLMRLLGWLPDGRIVYTAMSYGL